MELLQTNLVFQCFVVALFFLMELFAFDRKKKGVSSLLSVGAWVCLCMSLHLFQFFSKQIVVLMELVLLVYLVVCRIVVYFVNKREDNTSDGLKYCVLSILTLFFALAMGFVSAPKFVLIGIKSFVAVFFFVGLFLLFFQKDRSVTDSVHGDVASLSALLTNLCMLQCTGGALVVVSDFNSVICMFMLVLGLVGTVAMYVNKYSLTSLGVSVLLGYMSALSIVFVVR